MTIGSTSFSSVQRANDNDGDDKNGFRQAMTSLKQSLSSGDLKGAQTAFAQIQALQKADSSQSGAATGNFGSLNSTRAKDFSNLLTSIGNSLQAGDVAGAQKAMDTFAKAHKGHHHHQDAQSTTDPNQAVSVQLSSLLAPNSSQSSSTDPNNSNGTGAAAFFNQAQLNIQA